MIIIVEGPDGAGKTTAISGLVDQYPHAKVYHFGAPKPGEDQFLRYAKPIITATRDDLIIYDRSWYSEFVYGPVMRNTHELEWLHSKILEKIVVGCGGGHILYLTAKADILWDRCMKRGETYIENKLQLTEIALLYDEVMSSIPKYLPVFKVDTSSR